MKLNKSILALTFLIPFQSFAQTFNDYELAINTFEQGKIDESYIHLKNSIKDNPDHLPTKILMGTVLGLSGYYDEAEIELREALQNGADRNLVYATLIRVLLAKQDYEEILALSHENLTPKNKAELFSAKGVAARISNQKELAQSMFESSLSQGIRNPGILNTAAKYFSDNEDFERANALLKESLTIEPTNTESIRLQANLFKQHVGVKAQIALLAPLIPTIDYSPLIFRDLASAYIKVQDFANAKDILNKIIASSPNDPMAKFLISYVDAQLGNDEESKKALDKLINELSLLDDSDIDVNESYQMISGLANYAAGNYEKAKAELSSYVAKNPENFSIARTLVDIYRKNNEIASAAVLLQKFPDRIQNDIELVQTMCELHISLRLNHKCETLLNDTEDKFGHTNRFKQTKASLLSARGKPSDALEVLLSVEDKTSDVILQQALISYKAGRLQDALKISQQLKKDNPDNKDIDNFIGSIKLGLGNIDEAISLFAEIMEKNPEYLPAKYNLAYANFKRKNFSVANDLVNELLKEQANNLMFLTLSGQTKTALGDYEEALEHLLLAESINNSNSRIQEALLDLYIANESFDKGLVIVNKLLKESFLNPEYLEKKAQIFVAKNDLLKARNEFNILYGVYSQQAAKLFDLSSKQAQINDLEGALKSINRALELAPNNYAILRNAAKLKISLGLHSEAKQHTQKFYDLFGDNSSYRLLKGDLANANNELNDAALHYSKAIDQNNRLVPALVAFYQLAGNGIEVDRFKNQFSTLAQNPEQHPIASNLLADFYLNTGDVEKAKEIYLSMSSLENYPAFKLILNNLANIYLNEGKVDAAYNFAQQAYELGQPSYALLDTLGWILVHQEKYDNALGLLRRSYSMNALDPNNRYHIAYTLYKMKRHNDAKRELKIVLSEFGDFEKKDKALELQSLIEEALVSNVAANG